MSYQVLARKLRPQSFTELIGQDHVATTLLNALKSGRMPHALLFTGARGVGKTSTARILAKSLRCQNAKEFVPCHECVDCQEITSGRSVDVIEVDGASNNGVENIRELRETVGYMPSRGKYKIYIIDEVHMLSTSAFNALLKTLEEPPAHVVFIFATTEPHKIPVTILSRCQRFDFRRIPTRQVATRLQEIVSAEGVKAESQALWLVARESEGSMRDSLSLLEQIITYCGNTITHKQVIEVLGLTDRTILGQMLQAIVSRDVKMVLDIVERIFYQGYDPKQFAQDLLESLRNLMIVKLSSGARTQSQSLEFLDLPDSEVEELQRLAQSLSEEDIHLIFDMTLKGVGDVVRASDPRVVLEMVLIRLTQAPRLQSLQAIIDSLSQGKPLEVRKAPAGSSGGAGTGSLAKSEPASKPQVQKPVSPTPVRTEVPVQSRELDQTTWIEFIDQVKKKKPLLGAKLEYAAFSGVDGQTILLKFSPDQEFFYSQLVKPEALNQIKELAQEYFSKAFDFKVETKGEKETVLSPKEIIDKKAAQAHEDLMKKIEAHPLIAEAKNTLNARITSIQDSP
ncbi:MAG: DNA polymerase III subunit gamma/tau [Oligoflexia bacterium]|nr:DNA polymerase III subunit gamma/tau [Oligoflexia bacterium]